MADRRTRAALARAAWTFASGLPPLVLMTDDERLPDPLAAARTLPKGSLVILRGAQRETFGAGLAAVARARGLVLSIAGDTRVAASLGARALHLSEDRAHEAAHWRALRSGWLITCAAHSLGAAARAHAFGADAVLLSPVFETASHRGRAALGPLRLRLMAAALPGPVYALGGIGAANARRLGGADLAGLAAIGALAA
ncbi:MAG TPA: thiamine phosphate synthase [Rhizomicrobium sp.]|nr:thiamine phosphate synthase [Rhizomicrobium sp.]